MNLYDSTNFAIVSLLQVKKLEGMRLDSKTQKAAQAEIDTACYAIRELINAVKDNRLDGGPGSGNWGHIGIPGHWGGSQKGGGNAFRLAYTSYATKKTNYEHVEEEYTSQAKIRKQFHDDLVAAKITDSKEAVEKIQKRLSQINDRTKTAFSEEDLRKQGYTDEEIAKKFDVVHNVDKEASKHILETDNTNSTGTRAGGKYARGTAEGVKQTKVKKNSSGKDKDKPEDKDKSKDKENSENQKDKVEQNGSSVKREYDSQMALKIGTVHYDKAMDKLDSAEESTTKDIFTGNINSVKVGYTTGDAYYNSSNGTVNYSVSATENPIPDGRAEQQTFFHECAHALDFKAGNGSSFASSYNGGELASTLKEEHKSNYKAFTKNYDEIVEKARDDKDYATLYKMGAISRKTYNNLTGVEESAGYDWDVAISAGIGWAKQNKKSAYQRAIINRYATNEDGTTHLGTISAVSDITSAATSDSVNFGYHHIRTYWRDGGNAAVATETDADISSVTITSKEGLQAIKEIYPKTYTVWQKMKEAQKEKLSSMKG